jgi:hypothetical protein
MHRNGPSDGNAALHLVLNALKDIDELNKRRERDSAQAKQEVVSNGGLLAGTTAPSGPTSNVDHPQSPSCPKQQAMVARQRGNKRSLEGEGEGKSQTYFQFPYKLHDMLEDAGPKRFANIVSWNPDGGSFRVHRHEEFTEQIMPNYFRQTKYKSFQRQLNLYGFSRLLEGGNKGSYRHKYFRRDQQSSCDLISRENSGYISSAAAQAYTVSATSKAGSMESSLLLNSLSPAASKLSGGAAEIADISSTLFEDMDIDQRRLSKEYQFPWKLHHILDQAAENDYEDIASWQAGGSSFKVHQPAEFASKVMPLYFKQGKYKSFQRQLYLYGFVRIETGPHKGGYTHKCFIRNQRGLCRLLVRQPPTKSPLKDGRVSKDTGTMPSSCTSAARGSSSKAKEAKSITKKTQNTTTEDSTMAVVPPASVLCSMRMDHGRASPLGDTHMMDTSKTAREDADASSSPPVAQGRVTEESSTVVSHDHGPSAPVAGPKIRTSSLNWRQPPRQSLSDWTLKIRRKGSRRIYTYHVHRRSLAVGPCRSEYLERLIEHELEQNPSADKCNLNLDDSEADVFEMALDYMYSSQPNKFPHDLTPKKALALYSLAEYLEISHLLLLVVGYHRSQMTMTNVVDYIALANHVREQLLLDAAIAKCAENFNALSLAIAAKIEPSVFLSILEKLKLTNVSVSSQGGLDAHRKNLIVEYVHAQSSKISRDELEELTHPKYLPTIGAKEALRLLASESKIENSSHNHESTTSLRHRCAEVVVNHWTHFRAEIEQDSQLSKCLRSISSEALAEILLGVSSL